MILTLTPNPAADQTVWVDRFVPGSVHHAREAQLDPAGKGVNVSRVVQRLGYPTIAMGFLAGEIGMHVDRALREEGVNQHFERVQGQTRIDVTIVDRASGLSTGVYGPGPLVDAAAIESLDGALGVWLQAAKVLVLAGSLPRGLSNSAYAGYLRRARERGVKTILDADGEALRLGVEERPDVIKPNRREAERLLGRALPDRAAVVKGAREIAARGIGAVVVSLGEEGAICVSDRGVWLATPPHVELRSTVGSGDSLVAGIALALARGEPIAEGLRLGSAAGAATAAAPGTALGSAASIAALLPKVRIEELAV